MVALVISKGLGFILGLYRVTKGVILRLYYYRGYIGVMLGYYRGSLEATKEHFRE